MKPIETKHLSFLKSNIVATQYLKSNQYLYPKFYFINYNSYTKNCTANLTVDAVESNPDTQNIPNTFSVEKTSDTTSLRYLFYPQLSPGKKVRKLGDPFLSNPIKDEKINHLIKTEARPSYVVRYYDSTIKEGFILLPETVLAYMQFLAKHTREYDLYKAFVRVKYPTIEHCTTFIDLYSLWQNDIRILEYFVFLQNYGFKPTTANYNALLHSCRYFNYRKVERYFNDMIMCGVQPNANTYNTLILALLPKNVSKAEFYYHESKRAGHPCHSEVVYNNFCATLMVTNDYKKMDYFSLEAEKYGIKLNVNYYRSLFNFFFKSKDVDKYIHYFQKLKTEGAPIDSVTWNSVLLAYLNSDQFEEAYLCFTEMLSKEIKPFKEIPNQLVLESVKGKNLYRVQALYKIAKEFGEVEIKTFPFLISGFLHALNFNKVDYYLKEMDALGLLITKESYLFLQKCFLEISSVSRVDFFKYYFHKVSLSVNPLSRKFLKFCIVNYIKADIFDRHVGEDEKKFLDSFRIDDEINTQVSDYIKYSSNIAKFNVDFLVNQLKLRSSDTYIFNVVLNYYCTIGNFERVETLYNDMEQFGIAPNIDTYNCLIRTFSKFSFEKATFFFELMLGNEITPSTRTYSNYLFLSVDIDVEMIFERMKVLPEFNVQPDILIWTAIMVCFTRCGEHLTALRIFQTVTNTLPKEISELKLPLLPEKSLELGDAASANEFFFASLNNCVEGNQHDDLVAVWSYAINSKYKLETKILNIYLKGLLQFGKIDEVFNIYKEQLNLESNFQNSDLSYIKIDFTTYTTVVLGLKNLGRLDLVQEIISLKIFYT
ncbi:hypothetical protein HDU92_003605 [Lobulomyces angularis]|nr:hypothetical protein HDU92_003605 [Lobulomyces angularis]